MAKRESPVPPGRPSNVKRSALITLVCVLIVVGGLLYGYLQDLSVHRRYGGSDLGRWYGIGAAVIMVLLALYPIRRAVYHLPLLTMQGWYLAHIALGIIGLFAGLLHSGFVIHYPFLWLLTGAFVLAMGSGVWGMMMTMLIRPRLVALEEQPVYRQHVEARIRELKQQIKEREQAANMEILGQTVLRELESHLSWTTCLTRHVTRQQFRATADAIFIRHRDNADLAAYFDEPTKTLYMRLALARAEWRLHVLLRGWVSLHLASALLCMALVAVHIWTALYY